MAISFLYVKARGSYREIGRQIGEAARSQIEAAVSFYQEHFAAMTGGLSFAEAERHCLGYLPHARQHLPQYVEELEGMAEGAGQPFLKVFVPNCGEELTSAADAPLPGVPGGRVRRSGRACTAVAVSGHGRHVLGHNNDWYVVDVDKNVVYDITVPDGTRFVGIFGVPYLAMIGMNSHGVASVSNSMHSNDNRLGVPNAFVRRWVLEAPTLEEARERSSLAGRARGTNTMMADDRGRRWDLETSATATVLMEGGPWMAHTNHYVSPAMAPFEGAAQEESRRRLLRAETLLAEGVARGDDPADLAASVLRDHESGPDGGICGHPDESEPVAEQGTTTGSMICDLTERRMRACAGPPCENAYRVFDL